MIRLATIKDIDSILEVTRACAKYMVSQDIFQWNEHYPSKEAFIHDVNRRELYVKLIDNEIIGCIVISTHKDEVYNPIEWLNKNENSVYIHRLAVHPNRQGQGIAQELMDFAESISTDNGYDSIRLDTFSQNPRNQRFYEIRGYKRLGNIYFPKQSSHPFYCYELLL
jgi:ribosomal protein S18 acetylase RimI-like enzyme